MDGAPGLKRILQERVDSLKDRIIEIADYLHQNPELGYAETKACARLAQELESAGFKVTKGVAGLSYGLQGCTAGEIRKADCRNSGGIRRPARNRARLRP